MEKKDRAVLNEYLNNISEFYNIVTEWLRDKSLFCKERDYNINEKLSGEYSAKKLLIFKKDASNQIAEICPVGAWIIGADGRIDLIGDFDQQILIYLKKDIKIKTPTGITTGGKSHDLPENSYSHYKGFEQSGWYWIEDKRLGKAHAVNKELFFDLLAEVSDDEF